MTIHPSAPPGLDPLGATWLSAQQWPFPSGRLHAGSLDLAVTDVGSGPTLLLVHVGLWSFLWRDVITDLSRDFRVVTLDAPGTGRSDRLAPSLLTLKTAAHAVRTTIRQLDLRDITLVAHDLGGPAGLTSIATLAERIAALVAISTFSTGNYLLFRHGKQIGATHAGSSQSIAAFTGVTDGDVRTGFLYADRDSIQGGSCERTLSFGGYSVDFRQNLELHLHKGWNSVVAHFSIPQAGHIVSDFTLSSDRTGQRWFFFRPQVQPQDSPHTVPARAAADRADGSAPRSHAARAGGSLSPPARRCAAAMPTVLARSRRALLGRGYRTA